MAVFVGKAKTAVFVISVDNHRFNFSFIFIFSPLAAAEKTFPVSNVDSFLTLFGPKIFNGIIYVDNQFIKKRFQVKIVSGQHLQRNGIRYIPAELQLIDIQSNSDNCGLHLHSGNGVLNQHSGEFL